MSFLNPVNEPVLRFKSTDSGAPQINYNARVAGDVKAVLKACLVTGYGAVASAGWTAENEVSNVIEFVSPSAAMSDYRLGIDDTSASSTTWYYQYQGTRVNPIYNAPAKSFQFVDKTHSSNGWQLFVTARGILFIESLQATAVNKLSPRITYWGQIKSAITDIGGQNILFFNVGHNGAISIPAYIYNSDSQFHINIGASVKAYMSAATSGMLSANVSVFDTSNVDLVSPIYLSSSAKNSMLGEIPFMLSRCLSSGAQMFDSTDLTLDGRSVMSVCAGFTDNRAEVIATYSRAFFVKTDYWEY